jgi:hypothetical protein
MQRSRNLLVVFSIAIILLACGCVQQQPASYIQLNRSASLSDYVGRYTEASEGKTFLIVNMTLENHGYKTFEINPNYFGVVINQVAYPYDKATFLTNNPLTTAVLLDGGKVSGYLVFQVPKGITDYDLKYIGSGDYQFIYGKPAESQQRASLWTKQTTTQL